MGTRPGGYGGEDNWFDRSDDPADDELALEAADERLPWLESDEEDEGSTGVDTGRLIGLGLILLVVLVAAVGGVWLVANRGLGDGPAPDGSLIAAPSVPYKERPADPGGKTFAGTGDTSYAVGAGKEVESKLATSAPPPPAAAVPTPARSTSVPPQPSQTPPAEAGLPAGTAVQVGAYSTRSDAEAGWRRLSGQTDALSGVSHRILVGRADIGTVYRLQAAGGDKASAQALCTRLKAAGIACQVK